MQTFIIVGGGTSGLTVADRLSKAFPKGESMPIYYLLFPVFSNKVIESVLVIEYGKVEYAPGSFDPPNVPAASRWNFSSLPNPEVKNKTAFVVAGQLVGGSSAVNGMFFDRGSRFDYDSWVEAGSPEFDSCEDKWDWNGIFPYFQKVRCP
jgi:choline dehydrogenase-like flavoprotein